MEQLKKCLWALALVALAACANSDARRLAALEQTISLQRGTIDSLHRQTAEAEEQAAQLLRTGVAVTRTTTVPAAEPVAQPAPAVQPTPAPAPISPARIDPPAPPVVDPPRPPAPPTAVATAQPAPAPAPAPVPTAPQPTPADSGITVVSSTSYVPATTTYQPAVQQPVYQPQPAPAPYYQPQPPMNPYAGMAQRYNAGTVNVPGFIPMATFVEGGSSGFYGPPPFQPAMYAPAPQPTYAQPQPAPAPVATAIPPNPMPSVDLHHQPIIMGMRREIQTINGRVAALEATRR